MDPNAAPPAAAPAAAPAGDKPDMVDKVAASAQQKMGVGNVANDGAKREKFTDKLRAFFEKKTGKKVPSKISN